MKHTHKHTKPQPSWLLQGLMIRAGLYDPLPPVAKREGSGYADSKTMVVDRALYKHMTNWASKAWAKAKAAFVYDPDRT